jgi:hypothetical protein
MSTQDEINDFNYRTSPKLSAEYARKAEAALSNESPEDAAILDPTMKGIPAPMMKGTFAIYETPDGGRMLAYRPEGEENTNRIMIPAPMIRMIEAQQRGEKVNPLSMFKSMMGG